MPLIRVLIVDEHAMLRVGLGMRLDLEPDLIVVGDAGNAEEAIELATSLRPDVVLMDQELPGLPGHEVTRLLLARHPQMAVLLLSMDPSRAYHELTLDDGARGYISKFTEYSILADAIRQMHGAAHAPRRVHIVHPTDGHRVHDYDIPPS